MGLEYGLYYITIDSQGRTKKILLTKAPQVQIYSTISHLSLLEIVLKSEDCQLY